MSEFNELDLVELVLARQSSRVLAVCTCLRPEARRVSDILDGKLALLQNLIFEDVGHRYLCGRYEEVIKALQLEELIFKLGQLARPGHRVSVHHERRKHLSVTVFPHVEIEHEVDERPLQKGAMRFVEGEPGCPLSWLPA